MEAGAGKQAGWSVLLRSAPSVLPFCGCFLWMTQFLQQCSPMNLEYKVEFDPRGLAITGKTACTKFSHKACCQDPREQHVLFQMKGIRWAMLLRAANPGNRAAVGEATSAAFHRSLCIGFLGGAGSDHQKTTCRGSHWWRTTNRKWSLDDHKPTKLAEET